MTGTSERCHVCELESSDSNSAYCSQCGQRFHLVLTNTSDGDEGGATGKDCGAVWINDSTMALEFGCQRCLAQLDDKSASSREVANEPRRPGRARRQSGSARDIVRRKIE